MKPSVTIAVLAYNQEKYIHDAVQSALRQTYQPLEVILSDDCSDDKTFDVMEQLARSYSGPHKLLLNRNEENLHVGGHVKKISEIANGEIIVAAAGDDISTPARVEVLASVFDQNPEIYAVFSDMIMVDDNNNEIGVSQYFCPRKRNPSLSSMIRAGGGVGIGAAYAYRKECFSWPWVYPDFYLNEDRLLPLRAALLGRVMHVPQPLVRYRSTAQGAFRSSDRTLVMARYNKRYQREIGSTVSAAVIENKIGKLRGIALSRLAHMMPFVWGCMAELKSNHGFFGSVATKLIYNFLYIDTLFFRLRTKVSRIRLRVQLLMRQLRNHAGPDT